jgi:hypothetical protein
MFHANEVFIPAKLMCKVSQGLWSLINIDTCMGLTDSGANVASATVGVAPFHLRCSAHMLHNAVVTMLSTLEFSQKKFFLAKLKVRTQNKNMFETLRKA